MQLNTLLSSLSDVAIHVLISMLYVCADLPIQTERGDWLHRL